MLFSILHSAAEFCFVADLENTEGCPSSALNTTKFNDIAEDSNPTIYYPKTVSNAIFDFSSSAVSSATIIGSEEFPSIQLLYNSEYYYKKKPSLKLEKLEVTIGGMWSDIELCSVYISNQEVIADTVTTDSLTLTNSDGTSFTQSHVTLVDTKLTKSSVSFKCNSFNVTLSNNSILSKGNGECLIIKHEDKTLSISYSYSSCILIIKEMTATIDNLPEYVSVYLYSAKLILKKTFDAFNNNFVFEDLSNVTCFTANAPLLYNCNLWHYALNADIRTTGPVTMMTDLTVDYLTVGGTLTSTFKVSATYGTINCQNPFNVKNLCIKSFDIYSFPQDLTLSQESVDSVAININVQHLMKGTPLVKLNCIIYNYVSINIDSSFNRNEIDYKYHLVEAKFSEHFQFYFNTFYDNAYRSDFFYQEDNFIYAKFPCQLNDIYPLFCYGPIENCKSTWIQTNSVDEIISNIKTTATNVYINFNLNLTIDVCNIDANAIITFHGVICGENQLDIQFGGDTVKIDSLLFKNNCPYISLTSYKVGAICDVSLIFDSYATTSVVKYTSNCVVEHVEVEFALLKILPIQARSYYIKDTYSDIILESKDGGIKITHDSEVTTITSPVQDSSFCVYARSIEIKTGENPRPVDICA